MGPQCAGGISSHLDATREAAQRWLEYEEPLLGTADRLLSLALEDEEDQPSQPEVLQKINLSRRLQVPIFPGTLEDIPYIASQEITIALNCETDHKKKIEYNLRMAMKKRGGK